MKKRSVKLILSWVMVLALITSLFMPSGLASAGDIPGTTYYLATNGSDSNPGTLLEPFATINYAYSVLASGDTLIIREGTYYGILQIISKDNVTIKNYEDEKVIIQNGHDSIGYIAYIGTSSNASISGITFAFTDDGIQGNLMYVDSSINVKITNCEFYRGEGGIVARQGTDGLEVSGNKIHGMSWPYGGILLYTAVNSSIYNNVIYDSYFGVNTYGGTTAGNKVYNNTFYKCVMDIGGANISGVPHDNIFRNNIFSSEIQNMNYDNPDAKVDDFMLLNSFDYDCYNSVTMSDGIVTNDGLTLQQLKVSGVETNGFAGDPKFLNTVTSEFQIGRGSECTGRATDTLVPAVDILGQPRTSPNDLGAYIHADRTNYYVSIDGSDTNAGTDELPFKTFAYSISIMLPGDYLFIKAGTYSEGVVISGKTNLTIMNYQADKPVITQVINIQDSQSVAVDGFALSNSVSIGNSMDITVRDMDITGGQVAIAPGSGTCTDGYEISSCLIHSFQGEGAISVYNGKNGSIINNVFYNNLNQGILIKGGESVNNSIYNNTLYGNGTDLLLVYAPALGNPSNNTFKNNIFSNGLVMGNDSFYTTNVFDYNCYNELSLTTSIGSSDVYDEEGVYVNTLYPSLADIQARGQELNGFLGDPSFLYLAYNDFRLRKTSDCIGKGTSAGAPLYDIAGLKRVEPFDTGAYKFTGAVIDFYVDAAIGDDTNYGSVTEPFKTIQHAVDTMLLGDTAYIKGGIYNESISINNKMGNDSAYFNIVNVAGETVVIDSENLKETAISIDLGSGFWKITGLNIQDYTQNGIQIKGSSSNIELNNINISNVGENGIYGENSSDVTLQNVKVANVKYGMALSASTGWLADKSCIDNAAEAAASFNASSSNKVTSSVLINSKIGMAITDSDSMVIYNNDFLGNSRSDMTFDQASTGSAVKNNIFGSANSLYSLEIADINNDLDYNCYNKAADAAAINYNNSALTFDQFKALGKETNGILADPMFTDPASGNFLLMPYSLCAGKGLADSNSPLAGYDGANFEIPMDIGAVFSPFSLKTYYVSTTGDDNNDGSFEHPWRTIGKGMNTIRQSDTLYIRGGTYNERVNMYEKVGRPYTCFTVKNYNNEEVILDTGFVEGVGIKFSYCAYWKLEGLKLTRYTGAGVWVAAGSEYITMENLEIWNIDNPVPHNSGTEGILGDGGNYATVKNCYIHDIGQTMMSSFDNGVYIGYGAHNWLFDSNRINNVPGGGLNFYGQPSGGDDCTVINNTISNSRYGMVLTLGKRNFISNNTLYNNYGYDLYMDWWYNDAIIQNNIFFNDMPVGSTVLEEDRALGVAVPVVVDPVPVAILYGDVNNNIFRNNIIYNKNFGTRVVDINEIKTLDQYLTTQTLNTFENNIQADPVLEDAANKDFRLQDSSPCIDAGIEDKAPLVDITGASRVNLTDIGAYEYITYAVNPAADAYVRDGTYANTNYGSDAILAVKYATSVGNKKESYLKFDLNSLGLTGCSSAKLKIYCTSANSNTPVQVYTVSDDSWSETGITWNNKPATGTGSITAQIVSNTGIWYTFDITAYVNSELSNDNIIGICLKNTTANNKGIEFNSKEALSNKVVLEIAPCPPGAKVVSPATDSYVRDGTYANTNYGTATVLAVKNGATTGANKESYLKFDLNNLGLTGCSDAKLKIYCTYADADTPVQAYSVSDDSWSETGITWNNKPATGTVALSSQSIGSISRWYTFDITSFVNAELNGNKIVTICLKDLTAANKEMDFNSREALSYKARLEILPSD